MPVLVFKRKESRECVREVAQILYYFPSGWNWPYFCSTALVSTIVANFQNCHIWAGTLAIGKSSRSCMYTLYTRGWKLSFVFALRAAVSVKQADIQNCHSWDWNLAIGKKFQKWHIYPRTSAYFRSAASVSEIQADFPNCHVWAWNLAYGKRSRRSTYTLSTPWGQYIAYFSSTCSGFRDSGRSSKLP